LGVEPLKIAGAWITLRALRRLGGAGGECENCGDGRDEHCGAATSPEPQNRRKIQCNFTHNPSSSFPLRITKQGANVYGHVRPKANLEFLPKSVASVLLFKAYSLRPKFSEKSAT